MKTQRRRTILAVDDDEINLMILIKSVQDAGYTVKSFSSGEAAWEHLQNNPDEIDIALLDKMMPGMNGIELLRRIKASDALRHIPVILQTGDAGVTQMREGLENGAYYYLTKPFHPEIITAILHSAAGECDTREMLLQQMTAGQSKFLELLREGEFIIKTHAEARVIASAISQTATYPEFVALGMMELLSNAIEHGNLEIGYERKRQCLVNNTWAEELATRANKIEYASRVVHVRVDKTISGLHLMISDEGNGFDWRHYLYSEEASSKLNEPNGRGIAKSMIMLDDLRYVGNGNEVHCNIGLPNAMSLSFEKSTSSGAMHS